MKNKESKGISLLMAVGASLAVQLSWEAVHSVPWAILHGLLNWVYVLYRWLVVGV